jgi:inner membrane transporter RhtA
MSAQNKVMSTSRSPQSVLMVLGSCISLQFGAAVATPLLHQFGAGLTVMFRLFLAGALLLAVFRPRVTKWTGAQWKSVLLFGLALAGMNGFFFAAIARIPLGTAVTIEFAGPLLLAALLARRPRHLVCVAAAAIAIAVLGLHGSGVATTHLDVVGVLYALVAAAFWALYIVAGKAVGAKTPGHGALPIGMLIGALVTLPFAAGALPALGLSPEKLPYLAAVAILSSVIPYSLEFAALRRLDTHTFGVLLSLEPAVAAIAGWSLLGQTLTWTDTLAISAVVIASVVATVERRTATERIPPSSTPVLAG